MRLSSVPYLPAHQSCLEARRLPLASCLVNPPEPQFTSIMEVIPARPPRRRCWDPVGRDEHHGDKMTGDQGQTRDILSLALPLLLCSPEVPFPTPDSPLRPQADPYLPIASSEAALSLSHAQRTGITGRSQHSWASLDGEPPLHKKIPSSLGQL